MKNMERKCYIDNLSELLNHIEEYKKMFPSTYTSLDTIKSNLKSYEVDGICGISVSLAYPDKCYGFKAVRITPEMVVWNYEGIWKT